MPTIEELTAQVKELSDGWKKDAAELKSLKSRPDFSGLRHVGDGVLGTIEETDEEVSIMAPDNYRAPDPHAVVRSRRKALRQERRKLGYQPWGEFKSAGDFVRAGFEHGAYNGHGNCDGKFMQRLESHFKALKAVQGMGEGIGADGGFTVIPEFAPGIIDRVYSNDLFNMTDNYTVSGNNMTFKANAETSRADGSRHGGLLGYWVDEGQTITKSKPTVRDVTLKLNKVAVVVYLTDELIQDTGNALENYITQKASQEFNFLIGNALWNGSGVGQPLGVLNAPSLLAISKESGQTAATIVTENIEKMYNRFYAPNLPNARWFHNQDCQSQIGLLTLGIGAAGISSYTNGVNVSNAPYGTLKGLARQPIEFAATVGTQGDITLADMKQMLTISKGGVMQAVSMHVEFLTDQMALRFVMRVGGQPWEIAPITPFKGSNTQSNFVTIATRS